MSLHVNIHLHDRSLVARIIETTSGYAVEARGDGGTVIFHCRSRVQADLISTALNHYLIKSAQPDPTYEGECGA